MERRMAALLVVLALVLALACACTQTDTPETGPSESTSPSASPSQSAEITPEAEAAGYTFPLDEPVTFTVWFPDTPPVYNYVDDWAASLQTAKAIDLKTNVHFDWTLAMEPQTGLSIIAASGDWMDIFLQADLYYSGGLEKMFEDGIVLELTDLVEEHIPNYYDLVTSDDELRRECTFAGERWLSLYCIFTEVNKPQGGMLVRTDWLDEFGMTADGIATYDDYHEYLVKAKDTYGATMYLTSAMTSVYLGGGFDVEVVNNPDRNDYPFYVENGVAKFGPLEENYKEYVRYMNSLWNEGLIHQDSLAWTNIMNPDKSLVYNDRVSMVPFQFTTIGEFMVMSDNPDFGLIGVASAVKNEGNKLHIVSSNEIRRSRSTVVSTTCENWELFLAFANWGYTDEGAEAFVFGVEGETFDYDANGNAIFSDKYMTEDMPIMVMGMVYLLPNDGPHFYDPNWYYHYYADYTLESMDRAFSAYSDDIWTLSDAVTILDTDNSDYKDVMGDAGTYVSEMIPQFVTGAISIDAEWDTFIKTLEDLGIGKAVSYWQKAYDSYMSR